MWHLARSLRIEFPDALYHITARDDRQERIYADQEDWERFLPLLGEVVEDPNWLCHACCLITNHYHLVVGTREGNLSKRRRQLNGVYTQAYNRRHRQVGHLFQGKYKAVLVEAERYLLELARYVMLNPVRAGVVSEPDGWAWSSYNATAGEAVAPLGWPSMRCWDTSLPSARSRTGATGGSCARARGRGACRMS
jgi:putative transposase